MAKVLLVDDEADARSVLEWVLSEWGHDVQTAGTGAAALAIGRSSAIEILITDYVLEDEVNGAEVIRKLRELRPQVMVILMSGMGPDDLKHDLKDLEDITVMRKPFSFTELRPLLAARQGAKSAIRALPQE